MPNATLDAGAENSAHVDLNVFETIETHHRQQEREYAIGEIEWNVLASSNFWKTTDISIIGFNRAA